MDTISRENNSMLPVGGIIVGVIALLLGGYAAITLSKVNRTIAELDARTAKIEAVEQTANNAAATADRTARDLATRMNEVNAGFKQVGSFVTGLHESVTKLEEAAAKRTAVADKSGKKSNEPVVAGPNEYVVKPGDTGTKIARATGSSVKDIEAVNPGLNWNKLGAGQKIKLPAK